MKLIINSLLIVTIDAMDEKELQNSPSSSEFAELDSQIQRMSLHADSLLESIREESGDTDSNLLLRSSREKIAISKSHTMRRRTPQIAAKITQIPREYLSYEDDDMMEEEERLESITDSIRESLADSNAGVPIMQNVSYSTDTDCDLATAELVQESGGAEKSTGIVLLGCSIVWTMVMILIVHAQYFLLNERGQIQLPFDWIRKHIFQA